MSLADLVHDRRVSVTLGGRDKEEVVRELAQLLTDETLTADTIYEALIAREQLASTGVGSGVAIPHGRVKGLEGLRAALGVHKEGVPFDAVDGEPVHVFVAILAPEDRPSQHLKALAAVSRVLRSDEVRKRLIRATTVDEAQACFEES